MSNTTDRLDLFAAILALIESKRSDTGDPELASAVERAVIDSQFRELEDEILKDPGAIEPWLIRRRRGEN